MSFLSRLSLRGRLAGGLFLLTFGAFAPVLANGFTGYDDPGYVTENPHVLNGWTWAGLRWAFTSHHMGHWHPMTWLSHMLDVELWGLWAPGHHLTSVLLHATTAVLFFAALSRWTGAPWRSALVVALFSLHPLRVEAVAWAAERKEVLGGVFWALTLLCYGRYVDRPGVRRYLALLGVFALGLLSKGTLVTAPLVLLLLDYWPLRRHLARAEGAMQPSGQPISRLVVEKLPLLLVAGVFAGTSLISAAAEGSMMSFSSLPLTERVRNAVVGLLAYLSKTLWPAGLTAFYPLPRETISSLQLCAAAVVVVGVSVFVLVRRRNHPHLLVGWLFFLIPLVPVSGLFQAGMQWIADRYTYVPSLGLGLIAAFGFPRPVDRRARELTGALALFIGALLVVRTGQQLQTWRDSESLFVHMEAVSRDNPVAKVGLATLLEDSGRLSEAESFAREAHRISPHEPSTAASVGRILLAQRRLDAAIPYLRSAHQGKPDNKLTQRSLGWALIGIGSAEEGLTHFREIIARAPDDARTRLEYGVALSQLGRVEEALLAFVELRQLVPDDPSVPFNAGIALAQRGRYAEAIPQFEEALRLEPSFAAARQALERAREDSRTQQP